MKLKQIHNLISFHIKRILKKRIMIYLKLKKSKIKRLMIWKLKKFKKQICFLKICLNRLN